MTKNPKLDEDDEDVQEESNPELENLEAQVATLTEALQRERADAMNLRRQHDEQMAGLRKVVKVNVIRDLLPVIDNFERALKHVPEELQGNTYIKGIEGVVKQFEKTLSEMDVEKIPTVGQAFDPEFHEAVSMEEGEGSKEVVSEELQSGYRVGNDVVRHAMVRVTME
jgi:molecular chaperone GrpE